MREVISHFVDIYVMVDQHSINFIFMVVIEINVVRSGVIFLY